MTRSIGHRLRIGCLWLMVLIGGLIVLALAIAVFQGRRTPKGQPDYVALGSSFAAGADLGPLQRGSPLLCARSINGYPQQLARRLHLSIVDMSCGGAVTRHLLEGGQVFQGAQIRIITPQTRLVTVTVGGNDIGYIGDLSLLAARKDDTVFGWLIRTFWRGPKPEVDRDYAKLDRELRETLRAIRSKAPQAMVVVAAYPAVLPQHGACARLALTSQEADQMRRVGDRLAAVTRAAAAAEGATFVDMNKIGRDHGACSPDPWTRGWRDAGAAPFHPTARGAQATAAAIAQVVGERMR